MKYGARREYYQLTREEQKGRLKEMALLFLKLGATAFGGPAAHVALMEDEVVKKRKWVTKEKFLDLYSATNLLPGPNSTELVIHLGFERGGWLGLLISGTSFILPAMLIILAFAYVYMEYGSIPQVSGIMYGIQPVIMAIILQALIRLGVSVIKDITTGILGIAVIFASLFGFHELLILAIAGLLLMLVKNRAKLAGTKLFAFAPFLPLANTAANAVLEPARISLTTLFLTFLKIGSVLYGSGYVLLAFLEADFVTRTGLLTNQQLLDVISVGQFTPGPVFTSATFIGYIVQGIPGAILATIGIFLPAFLLVGIVNPFISRLRESSWVSGLLDGVNIGSWGLMAVVSWKLGMAAIKDIPTAALAIASLIAVFKFKINSAWLILSGGVIGFVLTLFS